MAAPIDESVRADFPILSLRIHGHPLIYLDNAATSQKPVAVLHALRRFYEQDNANVHRGVHELSNRATDAYESARARAAQFLNAPSKDCIIFTRGTTEGINLIAHSVGNTLKAGDVILLTEMEHHSNIVPWQMISQRTGAKLAYVPVTGDEGLLDLDALDRLLPTAKIISFTHVSNALGTINPAAEICARARRLGVTTVLDAAQSAGHMTVDVQSIGCDFLAFSGHKICGPTGIGVLFARSELQERMQPWQGGGEMISKVDLFHTDYNVPPHKFEAGTPDISGAVGLHAAMDYLDALGRDRIFQHDVELAHYARSQLAQFAGIRLLGPEREHSGLVSFVLKDVHALDLATMADRQGIAIRAGHHCTQPLHARLGLPSSARASFYFYNTRTEVDRFIAVLRDIQKYFKG